MTNPNWTWRPLGELFEIGAGKTMSAAARAGADKVPFLRTSNVLWDEIDLTEVDEMSIPPDELANKSLTAGDMLVCEGGEIGRAAVWDGRVPVMAFQNHLHRLRPIRGDVEPRFYVYFLQSAFTQLGIFEGAGNKTTIPNLSRNRLARLEVPHPPLAEQQDIARSLAKVREAIGVHEQTTRTAQELKRAAMRELFTRGLRGEPQKDTEIGPVPESWQVVPLSEVCIPTDQVNLDTEGDRIIQYIDVSSVSRESLAVESTSTYVLKHAPGRARKRVLTDDVVIATIRPTLKRIAQIPAELDNQVCSTAFCVLRTDAPRDLSKFIYYAVQRDEFVELLGRIQTGASYPAVTDKQVKAQPIPLPSPEEQHEIVAILDAIDRKIELHRRKKQVLEELFKALLHKLMTGEVRVTDLDLSALAPHHTSSVTA